MRADKLRHAGFALHFILAEEVRDALREFFRDPAAAADDLAKIDRQILKRHTALGRFGPKLSHELPVFEQGLRRNAPPVEARSAQAFLLDAQDAFLKLPRPNRRRV